MLIRQHLLLEFLRQAARPVTKMELMKWAFLLRREYSVPKSFYEFLPYHYGPYSFCLSREMDKLVSEGWVEDGGNDWRLLDTPKSSIDNDDGVRKIIRRFGDCDQEKVIDYAYRVSPEYTVNSRRQKLMPRAVALPQVYTSGYEGVQVDGFLDRLIQSGIERLVDVRSNPVARRYGFHRSTLSRLCGLMGIEYLHEPLLGIRSELRQSLNTDEDYGKLFDRYSQTTLVDFRDRVSIVAELVQQKSTVLVCMESNPHRCHRTSLARAVSELTRLEVVDLGGPK